MRREHGYVEHCGVWVSSDEETWDERYKRHFSPLVAWKVLGKEYEPDEDTHWTGIMNETGRVVICMVGDDRWEAVELDDLIEIPDNCYCVACGQIGCGHAA